MKKNIHILFILSLLLLTDCFIMTSCKKDAATLAKKELQVKPQNGFCTTHDFPNDTWTFTKKSLSDNDIQLDKTLKMTGTFPSQEDYYDIILIVDYNDDIAIRNLPLDFTTISPDGKSKQSRSIVVAFNSKDDRMIGQEGNKKLKRSVQVIYSQKNFPQKGMFSFDIYSKYSKISLTGIRSISIKANKNNPD